MEKGKKKEMEMAHEMGVEKKMEPYGLGRGGGWGGMGGRLGFPDALLCLRKA